MIEVAGDDETSSKTSSKDNCSGIVGIRECLNKESPLTLCELSRHGKRLEQGFYGVYIGLQHISKAL